MTSLIIAFAMSSGCAPAVDQAAERERLLDTDREFAMLSTAEGPATAFNTFLVDDAMQLVRGRPPVTGRQTIYEQMTAVPGFSLEWIPRDGSVAASGDLGWTWGEYVARYRSPEGEPLSSTGKYINVWVLDSDGEWRVLVDMGNQDPVSE